MQNKHSRTLSATFTRTRDSHAQDEHSTSSRNERFFASFATHHPSVPWVEVTVVAKSRTQAKAIAREIVAPLGLNNTTIEVD